ncbi:MAG: glycosyltransferase family protein [Acidimicrobiales bacterium]
MAATLEEMGVRVIRAQEPNPQRPQRDDWHWDNIVEAARIADLFLWTQTWNADPEGGYRALDALLDAGVPSASFHLDLYWGLDRQAQIMEYPFWRTDYVFTADGGHDDGFARNGINHHWMPPAIYGPDARRGTPRDDYRWPIIFVGSFPYPHPEHAAARREIVMHMQSRFGTRFRMYRHGVRGDDLADLYASCRVVVGDSCLAGRSPRYWSDRIPETLGRGAFLIHPHIEGIEDHFVDGEHLRTYEPGNMGQLITLAEHYVGQPDEAAAIGAAGQAHVQAHHTYRNRMVDVLATVGCSGFATTDEEPKSA